MTEWIDVEVAYATPKEQVILTLQAKLGITAATAIEKSGLLERFPEIDLAHAKIGIFGKVVKMDTFLNDRDRVEVYRPLIADPKEARKRRAAEGKNMKKGAGES